MLKNDNFEIKFRKVEFNKIKINGNDKLLVKKHDSRGIKEGFEVLEKPIDPPGNSFGYEPLIQKLSDSINQQVSASDNVSSLIDPEDHKDKKSKPNYDDVDSSESSFDDVNGNHSKKEY